MGLSMRVSSLKRMQSKMKRQTDASENAFFLCTPRVPKGKGLPVFVSTNNTSLSRIISLPFGHAWGRYSKQFKFKLISGFLGTLDHNQQRERLVTTSSNNDKLCLGFQMLIPYTQVYRSGKFESIR